MERICLLIDEDVYGAKIDDEVGVEQASYLLP